MGRFNLVVVAVAAMGAMLAGGTGTAFGQAFMYTSGISTQPVGHYEFCLRKPDECGSTDSRGAPVELTRELWSRIVEVNNYVNTTVIPRTDWELWGVEEYWSYPVNGYGDCEDYALEKRRLLIRSGVPAASLLMTVVRQPNGDGHAVLTVHTSMGDFVLDNLEPRVLRWNETEYQFLKRVSTRHAGTWTSIEDGRNLLVGSVR